MPFPAMEVARSPHLPCVPVDANATDSNSATDVLDLWRQQKQIPAPFVWPNADARPSSMLELDVPVVDIGAALHSAAGMGRAAAQVAEACASHGFFQVTGHGVDPALARAALDGAADFFRLPLATKQGARRSPGTVEGYASAHADRFAAKLPWKETLSFSHNHDDVGARGNSHVVVDYFTSALGDDFKHLGEVYQEYCEAMEEASLAIMEVLGMSLGLGRGYYRDYFADGSSIMRCNYYPRCPEPDRTLGTGPHCDPSALTILLQDGDVDGLQVLVDGAWRFVRPKTGELVVNIGDTFMAGRQAVVAGGACPPQRIEAESDCELVIDAVKDPYRFNGSQAAMIVECARLSCDFGQRPLSTQAFTQYSELQELRHNTFSHKYKINGPVRERIMDIHLSRCIVAYKHM
uniref:Gibberellin 20 oxidase 2 n=1 Tax=Aegilops tauschii TaxID=37682 RepID=M8CC01_AEGTA